MYYFGYLSLLIISTMSLSSALARAEDFKDFAELDLEELLNTTVISASKREQKLSEAPNAIYVITQEDIKRSGAVDLPDLFRMVPGVDVVNVFGNTYGVSARGFNKRFAEKRGAPSGADCRLRGWDCSRVGALKDHDHHRD